jgi:hypothetical protein
MHTTTSLRLAALTGALLLTGVHAPAFAQEPAPEAVPAAEVPEALRDLLRSVDDVPGAPHLLAASPDSAAWLRRIAVGEFAGDLSGWEQARAISLLSAFPDDASFQALTGLLAADRGDEVAGLAAYTLARSFGPLQHPGLVNALLQAWEEHPAPRVHEEIVRGLRWVPGADAEAWLQALVHFDNPTISGLARRALAGRAALNAAPVLERP